MHHQRRFLLITVLVCIGMCLSGCSTIKSFFLDLVEKPKITISNVSIAEMRLDGATIVVAADIHNPNRFGVVFDKVDYTLEVEGEHFAEGASNTQLDLRAHETTHSEFHVHMPFQQLGETLLAFLSKGRVDYVLNTVFRIEAGRSRLGIPVPIAGQLVLPKPPSIEINDFSFPDVSSSGVSTRVVFSVFNPNEFDVPVDGFVIHIELNDHQVLKHTSIAGRNLYALQEVEIPFELVLDFDALGASVKSLLERPIWKWKVGVDIVSGDVRIPFVSEGDVQLSQCVSSSLQEERIGSCSDSQNTETITALQSIPNPQTRFRMIWDENPVPRTRVHAQLDQ